MSPNFLLTNPTAQSVQLANFSYFPSTSNPKVPCAARIVLRTLLWGPNDYKPYNSVVPCLAFSINFESKSTVGEDSSAHTNLGAQ